MLTQRLVIKPQLQRLVKAVVSTRYYSSAELDSRVIPTPELRLSAHKKKQKRRAPFVKDFFNGNYDVEFAAFPEPQIHDRYLEFFAWLKPVEDYIQKVDTKAIDNTSQIPDEVLEKFKELGIFRAPVPDAYRGLELNSSEYAKLVETVSRVPVLGAYLSKRQSVVNIISTYGSDEQKEIYLPKIAKGECHPTLCISEDSGGSSNAAIMCKAEPSDCDNYWVLNGHKTYVVNANNADVFIVLAECPEFRTSTRPEDTISSFIVDRSANGITIGSPIETLGLRGLSLCHVTFKNTMIPKENIIGEVGGASGNFVALVGEGKQNIGSQAIGLTKRFLELAVSNLKQEPNFNSLVFKNDTVQETIGKICCSIYGMESIVYLTTGMSDNFVNQDCELEKCVIESFCADACLESLLYGIQVLGVSSHRKGNELEQLVRDAVCLTSYDGTLAKTKALIGMMGIQYAGHDLYDKVKVARNPLMNPTKVFKSMLSGTSKNKLGIADNLHPTLQLTADLLEESIHQLRNAVYMFLTREGRESVDRTMELKRISTTVCHLYVIAAVLARSSRSYCLGLRDSEKEIKLSQVYGFKLYERIQQLIRELEAGESPVGDFILKEISDGAFENNKYYLEHPLMKNF